MNAPSIREQPLSTARRDVAGGPWALDALLLSLSPLIQTGYSYWISVATVVTILTIYRLRTQLAIGFKNNPWILVFPPLMATPLLFEPTADLVQDILRTGREALVLCLMLFIIAGSTLQPPRVNVRRFTQCLTCLAVFLFVLTAIQLVALHRGIYMGIPKGFYVTGETTIPGELDLLYSNVRPAATFSEPSYLAFIVLSMLLVLTGRFERDRRGAVSAGIAVLVGLLSQAASFVLCAVILGVAYLGRMIKGSNKLLVLIVLVLGALSVIGVVTLALGVDVAVLNRLQNGASGEDLSIFVRIFGPASILGDYLAHHPLGVPSSAIFDVMETYTGPLGINSEQYTENGFLNLFFWYGVTGLPIAAVVFIRRDVILSIYLLSCSIFNGGFLTIDKLSVICLAVAVYLAFRRRAARNGPGYAPQEAPGVPVREQLAG